MFGYWTWHADYLIYLLPGLILALYAQATIQKNYEKYARIPNMRGLTGRDAAALILEAYHIKDVAIEQISGQLTDHYDPREKVLRLSEGVYRSNSISAVGIAAHEVGHAIQHHESYGPLGFRNAVIPLANIGSNLSFFLVFIGLFAFDPLLKIGIALFAFTVLFQLLTVPVEYNASNRAKAILRRGFLSEEEMVGVEKVLSAAALTYVASLLTAIGTLLRFLSIGRRRD